MLASHHWTEDGKRLIVTYTYENWKERLFVRVSEGEIRPHFFLPVRRFNNRFGYECWVMPLAPFVLLFYGLQSGFMAFWLDTIAVVQAWRNPTDA